MRGWQNLSIRRQFVLLGSTFFALLVLLLLLINYYAARQTEQSFRDYIADSVGKIDLRLSGYNDQLYRFMVSLAYDPVVQDFMASKTATERFANRQLLTRRLNQISNITDGIICYVIQPLDGNPAISERQLTIAEIDTFAEPTNNRMLISPVRQYHKAIGSSDTFFCYSVALKSYSVRSNAPVNTELGTVFMLLDGNRLGKNLGISDKTTNDTRYYVLDRDNKVVFALDALCGDSFAVLDPAACPKNQLITMDLQGTKYYVLKERNEDMGMTILSLTPTSSVLSSMQRLQVAELLVFLALVGISIVIFYAFQRSAVRPLWHIAQYVDRVYASDGQHTEKLVLHGSREAAILSRDFNLMLESMDAMNLRLLEAEKYKNRTEIAMLRNQINPHFLYNTLEAIRGMAFAVGSAEIAQMIASLGRVFRYSVKAPEFVTVQQEVDMLRDYLLIQQVRFAGRFSVQIDISQDSASCLIPKMLLQPMVENAIQHGLELRKSDGLLQVRSRIADGGLQIDIQDNGGGIQPAALGHLRRSLQSPLELANSDSQVKIGVLNVQGRIQRYYGETYGLEIRNDAGQGVTMVVRLPVRRE